MKNWLKNNFLIILIVCISLIVYRVWFMPNGIFTYSDWGYYHHFNFIELPIATGHIWSTEGLGGVYLGLGWFPRYLVTGYLARLGLPDWVSFNSNYFWFPVISGAIGYYLLGKKLIGSNLAGFVTSIVFNYSVATIGTRSGHLTLASAYSFAPFFIIYSLEALKTRNIKYLILSLIAGFIICICEFRAFYLIMFIFFFLALYLFILSHNIKKYLQIVILLSLIIVGIFLLNIYWLIPTIKVMALGSGFEFLSRGLFGDNFANILTALTSWNIWWTGGLQAIFIVQKVNPLMWIIPLLAFLSLLFVRKNKILAAFGTILVLGIFFAKQSGAPFKGVYLWLYNYFPGFNAFRESSKFLFLVVFACSILIADTANRLWLYKSCNAKISKLFKLIVIFVVALFLWNAKPIINKDLGTLFYSRKVPNDYTVLAKYLSNSKEFYRTISIPYSSRWSFYSLSRPKMAGAVPRYADWSSYYVDESKDYRGSIVSAYKDDYAKQRLDNSSIRYVIVPIRGDDKDDDMYQLFFGGSRDYFVNTLDKISYLKKIDIGTEELTIYENEGYYPHIYISDYNIYSTWKMDTLLKFFDLDTSIKNNLYAAGKTPATRTPYEKESFKDIAPMMDEILIEAKLENIAKDEELASYRADIVSDHPATIVLPGGNIEKVVNLKNNYDLRRLRDNPSLLIKEYLFQINGKIAQIKKYGLTGLIQLNLIRDYADNIVGLLGQKSTEITESTEKSTEKASEFLKTLVTVKQTFEYQRNTLLSLKFGGSTEETINNIFDQLEDQLNTYLPKHSFDELTYKFIIPVTGDYDLFMRNKGFVSEKGITPNHSTLSVANTVPLVNPTSVSSVLQWKSEEWNYLETKTYPEGEGVYVIPNPQVGANLLASDLTISQYQPDTIYKLSLSYKSSDSKGSISVNEGARGAVFTSPLDKTSQDPGTFETYFKSTSGVTDAYVIITVDTVEDIKVEQVRQEEIVLRHKAKERTVSSVQPKISFQFFNPTKYKITVTGAKDPFTLVFSESFHPGWKLFVDTNNADNADRTADNTDEVVAEYFGGQVKEKVALQQFDRNFNETWKLKPVADETHLTTNGFANSWYIKPEDVGNKTDYELIMEFTPQKYFYIGGTISLITLILLITALPITIFIERKKKRYEIQITNNK